MDEALGHIRMRSQTLIETLSTLHLTSQPTTRSGRSSFLLAVSNVSRADILIQRFRCHITSMMCKDYPSEYICTSLFRPSANHDLISRSIFAEILILAHKICLNTRHSFFLNQPRSCPATIFLEQWRPRLLPLEIAALFPRPQTVILVPLV